LETTYLHSSNRPVFNIELNNRTRQYYITELHALAFQQTNRLNWELI